LVTGYRCDLHHVQSLLEEATGGLVPKVMQVQAGDACAAHGALKGLFEGVLGEITEYSAVAGGGEPPKDFHGAARERHTTGIAVFGDRQEGNAPIEIHVRPLQPEELAAPHACFDGQGNEMHEPGVSRFAAGGEELLLLILLEPPISRPA